MPKRDRIEGKTKGEFLDRILKILRNFGLLLYTFSKIMIY